MKQGAIDSTAVQLVADIVKTLRTGAGLSRSELGKQLNVSESLIGAIERGDRIAKPDCLEGMDTALHANGALRASIPHLKKERYPKFFQDYAMLEEGAVALHAYDNHVINGLLQTEEYARALYAMRRPPLEDDEIERRVAARLARQAIFTRRPVAMFSFVVEEVVLQRPLGGRAVLRGQLQRLLEFARMRNVEIQVMPTLREDHVGVEGPMILLETNERETLAYLEGQGRSNLITEREEVSVLAQRYGILRAQALTPEESVGLIERLLGEA